MGLSWERKRKLVKEGKEGSIGKIESVARVEGFGDIRESSGEKEENLRKVPVDHPVEQTVNPIKVRVGFDSNNRE